MSSMTAQIAVGMPDLYHDGIRPTHLIQADFPNDPVKIDRNYHWVFATGSLGKRQ